MSENGVIYEHLVKEFGELTGYAHEETGRCCADVNKHGAPRCCYQLVNGEQLTFTKQEVDVWVESNPMLLFREREDGMWTHRDDLLTRQDHRKLLKDGWMAETLECASHPLRPIVEDGWVTGLAAVPDCNTDIALEHYRKDRVYLMHLWQVAVNVFGQKTYYATPDRIKKEWIQI